MKRIGLFAGFGESMTVTLWNGLTDVSHKIVSFCNYKEFVLPISSKITVILYTLIFKLMLLLIIIVKIKLIKSVVVCGECAW